jgi:hypothetical protein
MVTNDHRVEVEVGVDGHASALPSGAAAAAPPKSAILGDKPYAPSLWEHVLGSRYL